MFYQETFLYKIIITKLAIKKIFIFMLNFRQFSSKCYLKCIKVFLCLSVLHLHKFPHPILDQETSQMRICIKISQDYNELSDLSYLDHNFIGRCIEFSNVTIWEDIATIYPDLRQLDAEISFPFILSLNRYSYKPISYQAQSIPSAVILSRSLIYGGKL